VGESCDKSIGQWTVLLDQVSVVLTLELSHPKFIHFLSSFISSSLTPTFSHLNKTTTFERPQRYGYDESPPEPRTVVLHRNQAMGFGFVAGSEKPVIVRFVTESGPSVGKVKLFSLSIHIHEM
jgi:hypothetical protein